MWFSSWLRQRTVAPKRRPAPRFRPQLEALEDRVVPATFIVTTPADVVNAKDGQLSLREAIIAANASAKTADTIVLPAGNYTLTRAADENACLTGDLDINGPLSINGAGAGSTIVDAAGLDRVFQVYNYAVALSGMTIQGGNAVKVGSGPYSDWGGGILSYGMLTVSNSTVSGNTAFLGGGIFDYGTLTVLNSSVAHNTATDSGGGIGNYGTLTVSNSTLSGNSAHGLGGGAIWNRSFSTATVQSSTLSGNSALNYGGAIFNDACGKLTVSNSTLSDNSALYGGGIANYALGTATVQSSTLSGNSAFQGGGIYNSATLTVNNSNLLGNSGSEGGAIYNLAKSVTTLLDSTVSGNSASDSGGGIFNALYAKLTLRGSTVRDNAAPLGAGSDLYNLGNLFLYDSIIEVIAP